MAGQIYARAVFCLVSAGKRVLDLRFLRASLLTFVVGLGATACSPALNWRNVTLGDLALSLPCKPDHAQRKVPMDGQELAMEMVGCEADGALFAVSRVGVPASLPADQLQALWQKAALQQMRAEDRLDVAPLAVRPRSVALRVLSVLGQSADGQPVQARLAWVAAGTDIYHFAVYAARITPEMAEPFFDGVKPP